MHKLRERWNKYVQPSIETKNVNGRNNAFTYLENFNKNDFKLSYSAGDSIENIYSYYEEWIEFYIEICTENDSLYDIIVLFSIVVFYEKSRIFKIFNYYYK